MSTGYITVKVFTAEKAMPVQRAQVRIVDLRIALDQTIYTDQYGNAERIKVYAPEKETSLKPQDITLPYETYNIEVVKDGYIPTTINNVQVFPGEISLQSVAMMPQPQGQNFANLANNFDLPPNGLLLKDLKQPSSAPETFNPQTKPVFIPEAIRVHLGEPGSDDKTVLVSFADYVKNVASSEIYATWPKESLRANILAIISFALNRIYTGFYTSKGYNFDITADPNIDPYYVDGRNIYEDINDLVNEIFNEFIRRTGFNEPLLANYCNGITTRCEGLSQWGSVTLANQGKKAEDILKYYYGNVQREETQDIQGVEKKYPGKLLRLGDVGENVMAIQRQLNQIGKTYNNIPGIPVTNGNFDAYTQDAVRAFQKQFNLSPDGIVGKKTWYQLAFVYNAARRLLHLSQSRKNITVPGSPPGTTLQEGSMGADVRLLQYLLNAASIFYNSVFPVGEDGTFGKITKDSVVSFQKTFSLPQTGIVNAPTWDALFNVYRGIEDQVGAVLDSLERRQPGGAREETRRGQTQGTAPGMPMGTTGPEMTAAGKGETGPAEGTESHGSGAGTEQQRITEALNYANGIYPFGNRAQINMAYSSDILDYIPVTYSGKGDVESMPVEVPSQTNIAGMTDGQTGKPAHETDDETGISRGGKWKPPSGTGTNPQGSFSYIYTPGMADDEIGLSKGGAGRTQQEGKQVQEEDMMDDRRGIKSGTRGTYTGGQMQKHEPKDGQTGSTQPKPDGMQPGTAPFQMYNPWVVDDQMGGMQYGSVPSASQTFHTWMDDETGGDTTRPETQPFDYTPWMTQAGSTGSETGGTQPDRQVFDYFYEPEDMDAGRETQDSMSGMQTGPTAARPETGEQQGPAGMQTQRMRMPGMPSQPLGQIYQMRQPGPGSMPPGMPQEYVEERRTGTSDEMECPPLPIVNPPYQNKVLKIGSRGKDVKLMQEYLSYIALSLMRYKKITDQLKVVVNDGIYGIETTDAVIRFQNRYEMPVNGVIDAPTWEKIVEVYNTPCD